ncbi:hypothetical protein [Sphingobacterium deserti]|uniref:Uncharacterized protein n=1 Tax=Sphingobacterium deserti TaxID=1229276 RepID=A0A0B8T679_9SPHI|nr:hypothetical protein [Sphingobacterium deserti]KGE12580.1 hypothetical protein DI53_3620 [Sphingobacterium deserti]
MKIVIDAKSLIIGALIASVAFLSMGNKSQPTYETGKFQTQIRDNMVIITNTQNGDFIIATDRFDVNKNRWIAGEFNKNFRGEKSR